MRVTYYDGRDSALETESAGKNQAASFLLLLLHLLTYEWAKWREVSPAQCSFPKRASEKHYARAHRALKV